MDIQNKTAAALSVSDDLLGDAANELFGVSYLFPYQRLVIANILETAQAAGITMRRLWGGESIDGSDGSESGNIPADDRETCGRQIVILPTGAGKSLCFQLPAMLMDGITLVIYPLLGLMADQERRLAERGFVPVVLRGGQSTEEREAVWGKLRSGESRFIIANPEILLTEAVTARLKEIKPVHVVIDEAHCVSEWGESFRPSYLEIGKIVEAAAAPIVTAFTATAGAGVLDKIERYIFGGGESRDNIGSEIDGEVSDVRRIVGNPDRKNISYAAKGCLLRNLAVRDLVLENPRPAIVFCSSRPGTENLARYLRNEAADMGLPWSGEIRFYHAGLSREERKETERWFLHSGEAVLAATCAYGLGIDKPDIRTVIHRDCPPSVEAYLQESGRAGRDGQPSAAVLLWGPDDERALSQARGAAAQQRLAKLFEYARDCGHCRRLSLLRLLDYDGETDIPAERCCDVCEHQSRAGLRAEVLTDLREEASLRDFFRRNKRRYTTAEAARVLAAASNIRWTEDDAEQAINYLLKTGNLKKLKNPLWKNKLTPA